MERRRRKFDWSEHHRVISEQCAEWRQLKQTYPEAKICIAGDFNTDMGSGAYYGTKQGIAALRRGSCRLRHFLRDRPVPIYDGGSSTIRRSTI